MSCRKIRKLLPLYVSGDVDTPQMSRVDVHVADCPGCRKELQGYTQARVDLAALATVPSQLAETDPWPQVQARLGTGHGPRLSRFPGRMPWAIKSLPEMSGAGFSSSAESSSFPRQWASCSLFGVAIAS